MDNSSGGKASDYLKKDMNRKNNKDVRYGDAVRGEQPSVYSRGCERSELVEVR